MGFVFGQNNSSVNPRTAKVARDCYFGAKFEASEISYLEVARDSEIAEYVLNNFFILYPNYKL